MIIMVKAFFQKWIDKIRNSAFIKSVLTLSAGVVVSQAIALFTTPVISRIYNPQVLGDFTLITANSTIIGTVICMGFLSAIMLPKEDEEAKGLCRLLLKLIVGGATALLAFGILISSKWNMFSVSIDYRAACIMLWASVILDNISNLCYSYVNRHKLYKVLFWNPTLGTVSNAIVNITMGLLGFGLWGYLWSHVLSKLLIIAHMLRYANPFIGKVSYKSWTLIKQYRDFPMVLLPSNIIGTLSAQMPVWLLDRFWGSFALGSYSMCMTIMKLPSRFLAGPVNRVFYREASERVNHGESIGEFAFSLIKANVKLAVIPVFLIIVLGRPLFSFILGEEWGFAGDIASVMSVYILLSFCTSCLSGKFVLIGKKKTILILNIAVLVTNAAALYLSYVLGLSALAAITVFSLMGGCMSLLDLTIFMRQTGVSLRRYFGFVVFYLLLPIGAGSMLRFIFNLL